ERREPRADVDLDPHLPRLDAVDRERPDPREHRTNLGLIVRPVGRGMCRLCVDRERIWRAFVTLRNPRVTCPSLAWLSMSSDARHRLGTAGEQLAVEHLQRRGLVIVDRNYRTRWGELDVVALDGRALVFCEVKTRRASASCGGPLEAVTAYKQAQVRRMAAGWLRERARERRFAAVVRFDAIGVTVDGA